MSQPTGNGSQAETPTRPSIEVWCRVVDNYGDAAVCWRLARQLSREHGCNVRLRIDEPSVLDRLLGESGGVAEALTTGHGCVRDGVEIHIWTSADDGVSDMDVVIAAFACTLPDWRRARLAPSPQGAIPLWINLEYLSAEPWIDTSHGMPSTKPSDGAVEWFFFPGFSSGSGGLLREATVIEARDRFVADGDAARWLASHGVPTGDGSLIVSLFCYDDAPVAELLAAMRDGPTPVTLLVPGTVAGSALTQVLGADLPGGAVAGTGALRVHRLTWLSQLEYDRLLWSCDLNFVRGEDSWIRAHWAMHPMVWSPYVQAERAHLVKLDAWLERCLSGTDAATAKAVRGFCHAWSGDGAPGSTWAAFVRALPDWPFATFARSLARQPDLAASLLAFLRNHLPRSTDRQPAC